MNTTAVLMLIIALALVGLVLFVLVSRPTPARRRVLGLAFLAYGLTGLAWPGGAGALFVILAALLAAAGFGLYLDILFTRPVLLLALAYGLVVLAWPEPVNPAGVFGGAVLLTAAFERGLAGRLLPPPPAEEPAHSHGGH